MTVDQALAVLKELRALERLQTVIAAAAPVSGEWRYAVAAIADRLQLLRYGLSQQDPQMLGLVEAAYQHGLSIEEPQTAIGGDGGREAHESMTARSRLIH